MTEQLTPYTELQPRKVSAMGILASRLQVEPQKLLETLKNTVWKGASNEELVALTVVANEYGLNPLVKELYAFPAKGGGIVPIVSIDGWLRIINEHPQTNGLQAFPVMEGDKLVAYTCRIFRKDREHPTEVTEYLTECKRNTEPWKMEHRMLRHKSVIQCARIAFGFSGIHDEDEGQVIAERAVKGREITTARNEPLNPFDISKCQDCGEFKGHGHECRKTAIPDAITERQEAFPEDYNADDWVDDSQFATQEGGAR